MSVLPDPGADDLDSASLVRPGGNALPPGSGADTRTWVGRFAIPSVIALGGAVASYAGVGEGFAGRPSVSQIVATGVTACITYFGAAVVADRDPADAGRADDLHGAPDVTPEQRTVALCYLPGERTWADWTATVLVRGGVTVLRRGGLPQGNGLEYVAEQLLEGADHVLVLLPEIPPQDLSRYADCLNRLIGAHEAGKPISWIRYASLVLWPDGQAEAVNPLDLLPRDTFLDLSSQEPDVAASTLVTRLHRSGVRPGGLVTDGALLTAGLSYPAWGATITNLPPRNPHFTDRDAALVSLAQCLLSDDGGPRPDACGLVGLPGVGKTQAALEFGHRFASHYDVVWWVNAERQVSLVNQLSELARALGTEEVPELTTMLTRLWAALRERSRWLLIYDNVEQPPDVLTIWPRASNGDVLITSRNPNWGALGVTRVPLKSFDLDDGVAFLLKRTGESDRDAAWDVTARLGGLPLALECVGAYVEERRASLASYRALLGEGPPHMSVAADPDWYAAAMATSWNVSFEQACDGNPHVRALLSVFSFLAPDDIPRDLIPGHMNVLAEEEQGGLPATRVECDRAVAVLVRLSLVDATEDRITIHRLAQEYVLSRMTGPEERRWAVCSALMLVGAAFPGEPLSPASWVACRRIMPHVLELTEPRAGHYPLLREHCPAVLGSLLLRAGRYLHLRGEHGPARELLERALDVESSRAEPDRLATAMVLAALGRLYYHQAELGDARRVTEQAIAVAAGELGEHHHFVGRLRLHLSRILRELTALEEAEQLAREVLEDLQQSDGEPHPLVAEAWATYGDALWRRGRLREAAGAYRKALDVRSALPGTLPIDMATCHKHLGIISRELDDLDVAEQELRAARTLLIAEYGADYGEDHRDVIDVDGHLAEVLRRSGRLEEAYRLLRRVVTMREEEFQDHPDVAGSLTKLGALLRDQGRYEESESVLSRAVAMFERCMGSEHPYVADAAVERTLTRRVAGDHEGAIVDISRAVSIYAAQYGAGHRDLQRAERIRREVAP